MRSLALVLLAAASAPAFAQPSVIIPAPPDPLGDLAMRRALADPADAACRRGALADAIIVCGRVVAGGGYRVPWAPEPGARVRLIAGEAPSAMAAMGADRCIRLCLQPLIIDIGSAVRGLARGIDRILHPD
ncbi:MAG TPA: hypothetical protein VGO55_03000 [Allosphingosinicella sp.]|jgi:hypothetical protein|nr:hypothetical protein [Allosphingosinicella sp.]